MPIQIQPVEDNDAYIEMKQYTMVVVLIFYIPQCFELEKLPSGKYVANP